MKLNFLLTQFLFTCLIYILPTDCIDLYIPNYRWQAVNPQYPWMWFVNKKGTSIYFRRSNFPPRKSIKGLWNRIKMMHNNRNVIVIKNRDDEKLPQKDWAEDIPGIQPSKDHRKARPTRIIRCSSHWNGNRNTSKNITIKSHRQTELRDQCVLLRFYGKTKNKKKPIERNICVYVLYIWEIWLWISYTYICSYAFI